MWPKDNAMLTASAISASHEPCPILSRNQRILSPHSRRLAAQQSYLTRRCRQWKSAKLALDRNQARFDRDRAFSLKSQIGSAICRSEVRLHAAAFELSSRTK